MFLPSLFVQQPLICSLYFFYNCLLLCFHVHISAAPCSHHPTKIRLQLWRPQSSCDFGATEAPILCDLMWSGHSSGILRNIEDMVVKMIWQSQHVCTSLVCPAMTRLRTLCIACSAKIGKKMARSRGICVSTEVKTVQVCCKTSLIHIWLIWPMRSWNWMTLAISPCSCCSQCKHLIYAIFLGPTSCWKRPFSSCDLIQALAIRQICLTLLDPSWPILTHLDPSWPLACQPLAFQRYESGDLCDEKIAAFFAHFVTALES